MKTADKCEHSIFSILPAILSLIFILSGCSAVQQTYGIPATDLSWIKFGMSRTDIQIKLGTEIMEAAQNESSGIAAYEFNRGYHPPSHDSPIWWPAAAAGWEALNLMSLGSRSYWERECQVSILELQYDSADVLIGAREEMKVNFGSLNGGTQDICARIRSHLIPSTLSIGEAAKP